MFQSLKPGDLLMGTCAEKCGRLHNRAVLKVGEDEKGFFINVSQRDEDLYLPWKYNPLRWDEKIGAVVDCDGDSVTMFSSDLQFERGGCIKMVEKYKTLPRTGDLPKRFSEKEILDFFDTTEGKALVMHLGLIFANSEIAPGLDEISLVLQTLGIDLNPRNLAGIITAVKYMANRSAQSDTPTIAVVIAGKEPSEDTVDGKRPTIH